MLYGGKRLVVKTNAWFALVAESFIVAYRFGLEGWSMTFCLFCGQSYSSAHNMPCNCPEDAAYALNSFHNPQMLFLESLSIFAGVHPAVWI